MKDFSAFDQSWEKLQERKKILEQEEKQIIVRCSHQNKRRKLRIRPVDEKGNFQCKDCNTVFSMNPISKSELTEAVRIIHDALQQIRLIADPERESKTIRFLGELDFNNEEIIKLYARTMESYGKGKNKDKFRDRDRDSHGSYGTGAISFINTSKKHR